MAQFLSDRDWTFDVAPEVLWDRIATVEDYREWWPWLRGFEPDGGLEAGAQWRCEVTPPMPYVVRFTVHLERVEHARAASARVDGDIRGQARLTVDPDEGDGCRARLRSRLEPANPMLRTAGRLARPVVEWGHDWVLDQGLRQFVATGFDGRPG